MSYVSIIYSTQFLLILFIILKTIENYTKSKIVITNNYFKNFLGSIVL